MKIDNIEKCQVLLDKRAALQRASLLMADLQRKALITVQGFARDAARVELTDDELNLAIQDAIDARIQAIEKQIELL